MTPSFRGNEGRSANSDGVIVGDALEMPWKCDFSDEVNDLITIENSNGDDTTWVLGDGFAVYRFGDVDGDDWLFTPPLKFEEGKNYRLTSDLVAGLGREERIEVKYGLAASSEAMTGTIAEVFDFSDKEFQLNKVFTMAESGNYVIGIHTLSSEDHFALTVNSICVEETYHSDAPGTPGLSIEAGEKGDLSAILTITAPNETFMGGELKQLDSANIYLAGEKVGEIKDVAPGQVYTYTDTNCQAGYNTYTVEFINSYGSGEKTEATVFVGMDAPLPVANLTLKIEGDGQVVTWEPQTVGVNGGYVDPASLQYSISYYNEGAWVTYEGLMDETEIETDCDMTGFQRWLVFGVIAINENGQSDPAYSNVMIVGDSYDIPLTDTFDGGANEYFWANSNPFGTENVSWTSSGQMSAGQIGGCLVFSPYMFFAEPPFISTLTSGLLNVSNKTDLAFSFWYYNDVEANTGDTITVEVYDQYTDTLYPMDEVTLGGTETGWLEFSKSISIPESMEAARVHITINSVNGNRVYIDDFNADASNAVASLGASDVIVNVVDSQIVVAGLEDETVGIFSANGQAEYNGKASGVLKVTVSKGIYIVNVGGKAQKVMVK